MHTGKTLIVFSVILTNDIVMNGTGRKQVFNHTGMRGDICWGSKLFRAVYYEHHGQARTQEVWAGTLKSNTVVFFACMHSTHTRDQSISQRLHRVAGHIQAI